MIRPAAHEDIGAMVEMGRRFHEEAKFSIAGPFDPGSFATSLEQWIDNDAAILLVAREWGRAVGMTCAILTPLYFNQNWLYGQELFWWVKPEHRKGIGAKLATALEDEARARGVMTWGMAANENLRPETLKRFYRGRGFEPVERIFMKRL